MMNCSAMIGRLLALLLPAFLPLPAVAQRTQEHSTPVVPTRMLRYESTADSLAYASFTTGLRAPTQEQTTDTSTAGFRMAWRMSEFGGTWYAARGDSSALHALHIRPFHTRVPAFTADGRRVLVVTEVYPCALTCHTVWYFVEDPSAR